MPESESRVTNAELAMICRQFATLTKADINILEILETLHAQTTNPFLREVLEQVRQDVEMGHTLATSFSRYPNTFSPFFITMLREGELEGELDTVFDDLADHYETRLGDTPDARRPARAGIFDWEAAAAAFQWIFIWLTALGAVCALGAGLIWYATAPGAGPGLPGERLPNILIFVGIVMGLGILVFTRGRRRR
ncbi:MAG: type II secretion system F family protein [Armatimonadota bacterium]